LTTNTHYAELLEKCLKTEAQLKAEFDRFERVLKHNPQVRERYLDHMANLAVGMLKIGKLIEELDEEAARGHTEIQF
jgi:hypothetical protein